MTSPRADVQTRRVGDDGTRLGRAIASWRRWKDVIFMVVLLPTSVVAFWASIHVKENSESRAKDARVVRVIAQQQAQQQRAQRAQQLATAASAKLQCQRSKAYGPALADYYERQHVLPLSVVEAYRRTIPKTCPK